MKLLQPKELILEGFRSFKDRSVVTFPTGDAAVLIRGNYIDSEVSSGSGKSSLLMALAFALDVCDLPATELVNWDSKKLYVKLTLTDGENDYIIERSPKLTLTLPEGKLTGKTADEKLQQILGHNPDLVKTLTYRKQGETESFISAADSANKEFLSAVLGLEKLESAADAVQQELNTVTRTLEVTQARVDSYVTQLQNPPNELKIKEAEQAMVKARQEYALKSNSQDTVAAIRGQIHQLNGKLNEIQNEQRKLDRLSYENQTLKPKMLALKQEVDTLKASICPTCKREWDSAQLLIDSKSQELAQMAQKMRENLTALNQAATQDQSKIIADINTAIAQKNTEMGQINGSLESARQVMASATAVYESLVNEAKRYAAVQSEANTYNLNLETAKRQIEDLTHVSNIIGRNGFLSVIFDEVLAEIETKTNEYLGLLPNVALYTVAFSSVGVTKSGVVKKTISKTLYKNGNQTSIKTLSGGQHCALVLCTELAIRETIRNRSGSSLGWMVLDEAMDGLDNATKAFALELIKTKVRGLVLLIDHATEIRDTFAQVIQVEYNGKDSNVRR